MAQMGRSGLVRSRITFIATLVTLLSLALIGYEVSEFIKGTLIVVTVQFSEPTCCQSIADTWKKNDVFVGNIV